MPFVVSIAAAAAKNIFLFITLFLHSLALPLSFFVSSIGFSSDFISVFLSVFHQFVGFFSHFDGKECITSLSTLSLFLSFCLSFLSNPKQLVLLTKEEFFFADSRSIQSSKTFFFVFLFKAEKISLSIRYNFGSLRSQYFWISIPKGNFCGMMIMVMFLTGVSRLLEFDCYYYFLLLQCGEDSSGLAGSSKVTWTKKGNRLKMEKKKTYSNNWNSVLCSRCFGI